MRSLHLLAFIFAVLLSPVSATIKPLSLTPGTAGLGFKEVVFTSDQVNANDPSVLWKVSGAPLGIPMGNTGKYVGKPTTPGNFTLSVFVYVKVGGRLVLKDSTTIKHTINATTPPTINGSFTLPSAQYDQRYQQVTGGYRLTASGDYPFPRNSPYPNGFLWAAIPGASTFQSLPQGLILSPDGVISGVPTGSAPIPASNQTYTFKAKATDLVGKFSIATFTLTILRAEPPEILSACPLPEGLELFTYPAVTVKGAKGKINYTWSVSPVASFPPGLKLDPSTGVISGKPTLKGLFNFEITLRDKNGLSANKSCSINIRPAPEIIKKQIFSCVRVGDTLYEEIEARGGDQPYTWSVTGGAPPGIGIVQSSPSKGKIGGNFTTAGFFQVNIKAAEKGSRVDIEQFSFEVRPALGITTSSPLAFGIRGFAYPGKAGAQSVKIEPSGGWAPYSWQVLSGQLPFGLSISPSTGVISGTPTKTGTFKFTVRIKDSCKTPEKWVDKEFEIVIYDPITVFSDPIPCLTINKTFSSSITASGGALPYTWQIVSSTSPAYQISVPSSANSKVAQLSGVPEQVGPVALTVSVTSLGMTESFTINHTVNPELQITSVCPPSEMTVGNASPHSFSAIGGKGNYTWSINQTLSTNGAFPAGLILSGNKITGTPSVPAGGFPTGGDSSGAGYTLAVDVRDECGNTATKVCSATLYPALENPIAAQLCLYDGLTLNGTQLFAMSGGKPPYVLGQVSGLPPSLTLSSNGSLSGTINGAGNFTVSATATDSLGNTKLATCNLTILPKLAITTPSPLPVAYIGSNYSTTINATGGKRCYTWSLNSTSVDPQDFGNLQIGNLTCNSSTTFISGIPKKVGNYTLTINATDACGQSANQTYAIEVKKNAISSCSKEIWVVISYMPGTHKCNEAKYNIFANGEPIMVSNLNNSPDHVNEGGGIIDWKDNPAGAANIYGYANGNGSESSFSSPSGIAVASNGNVTVADQKNNLIRKIVKNVSATNYSYGRLSLLDFGNITANVTTLAGNLSGSNFADGNGMAASFSEAEGVAVDGNGTIYVADTGNNRIRTITQDGTVSTLAGNGTAGFGDGVETAAIFSGPRGIAVDGNGTIYVADTGNNRIRKITPNRIVSTLAGSGEAGFGDGSGTAAIFSGPSGVAVDGNGTVYVADTGNNRIRKITANGIVSTLAGSGEAGFGDGSGTAAIFSGPSGIAVDGNGIIYVADTGNHRIRTINSANTTTTLAGVGTFMLPEPFKSTPFARYNRVLISGEKLDSIADKNPGSSEIIFTAFCALSSCWHDKDAAGVGSLSVYTTNSTSGIFPGGTTPNTIPAFKSNVEQRINICTTVNLTPALQSFSASNLPESPSSVGFDDVNYSSMALISPVITASTKLQNTLLANSSYKIGNYEITNQQYTDFLNMVAKADPNNLYNTLMTNSGIQRGSGSGSFTYSVDSGAEDYPVIYVSWYDAARYANWLTNGKPTGSQGPTTTENGAYNLASSSILRNTVNPNTGAPPTFWLLNESEWYTSAYLKSDASALWAYPTQSNSAPDASGSNPANFANFGGVFGETTPVGFYNQSPGPFGTFDQGGNVREWTETNDSNTGKAMRIIRGGSWADPASAMRADESQIADPSLEDDKTGFRIGGAP